MALKIKNTNGDIVVDGVVVPSPSVVTKHGVDYKLTMVGGSIEVTKNV